MPDADAPVLSREKPSWESMVNAGWRPRIGWVTLFAVGYALLLFPLVNLVMAIVAWAIGKPAPVLPELDKILLLEMVGIMVGYRTLEKMKDVAAK